ncbi:MAG: hypothetical protein MMC33_004143 [Icmadophila ericetorum]|nr:hypothetical protein [Icmadophila ericetorum]
MERLRERFWHHSTENIVGQFSSSAEEALQVYVLHLSATTISVVFEHEQWTEAHSGPDRVNAVDGSFLVKVGKKDGSEKWITVVGLLVYETEPDEAEVVDDLKEAIGGWVELQLTFNARMQMVQGGR